MLKTIQKLALTLGAVMLLTTAVHAKPSEFQVVEDTYKWFNKIAAEKRTSFFQNDVAQYFSHDAKMITNNKLACEGVPGHYDHFVELNKHYKLMHIDIDSIDWRKAGDRIYLNYLINAIDLNNQTSKIYVMGYMVIKNEKIVLFNEIVHKEPA